MTTMLKKLKSALRGKGRDGKKASVRKAERQDEIADELTDLMEQSTMTGLKKSSLVSSKIRKEPPVSIDATKPKLSLKQVFLKRNGEFERLPGIVVPKSYHIYLLPHLDLFTFDGKVVIEMEVLSCCWRANQEEVIKKVIHFLSHHRS